MNFAGIIERGTQPNVVFPFDVANHTDLTAKYSKAGAALTATNHAPIPIDATSPYYSLQLTATETNTLGTLFLVFSLAGHDDAMVTYQVRELVGEVSQRTTRVVASAQNALQQHTSDTTAALRGYLKEQVVTSVISILQKLRGNAQAGK